MQDEVQSDYSKRAYSFIDQRLLVPVLRIIIIIIIIVIKIIDSLFPMAAVLMTSLNCVYELL